MKTAIQFNINGIANAGAPYIARHISDCYSRQPKLFLPSARLKYLSIEAFLTIHGTAFASKKGCQNHFQGLNKQCYFNAMCVAAANPDQYIYVEGLSCSAPDYYAFQHAWVYDIADNKIFDPTLDAGDSEYLGVLFNIEYAQKAYSHRNSGKVIYIEKGGSGCMKDIDKSAWMHQKFYTI